MLYAHQKHILDEDPKKTGLFLGTGSGKTRIALSLAEGKTLVICPKTQKEDENWQREFANLDTKITALEVISKETFRRDHEILPIYDTVIVDEAHTCLGVTPNTRQVRRQTVPRTSQLFQALDAYVGRAKPSRLYLATATIIRSPMTVWGAGKILGMNRGTLESFLEFRKIFYDKLPMPGREVYVPKKSTEVKDRLAKLVRKYGYVGRLEDFFDVPEQTFKNEYLELTSQQERRLRRLKTEFPEPIVRLGKRHQVENGILSGDEYTKTEFFENAKIGRLLEYALEFPRMVIFAKYRSQIAQMKIAFEKEGYKVLVLEGDTKDRGALIAEANASEACIFIAQAQISAGWELPEYPVMIFASRTYSFVDYDQGLGRIQRANNIKRNLYINLIVRGGIDEAVHKALENKSDFNERIYLDV